MAAIHAEKQQSPASNATPEQQQTKHRSPGSGESLMPGDSKRNDLESGTNGPSKPLRRKFSRTVPYETEIDGQEIVGHEVEMIKDSVSVIVLLLLDRESEINELKLII